MSTCFANGNADTSTNNLCHCEKKKRNINSAKQPTYVAYMFFFSLPQTEERIEVLLHFMPTYTVKYNILSCTKKKSKSFKYPNVSQACLSPAVSLPQICYLPNILTSLEKQSSSNFVQPFLLFKTIGHLIRDWKQHHMPVSQHKYRIPSSEYSQQPI